MNVCYDEGQRCVCVCVCSHRVCVCVVMVDRCCLTLLVLYKLYNMEVDRFTGEPQAQRPVTSSVLAT